MQERKIDWIAQGLIAVLSPLPHTTYRALGWLGGKLLDIKKGRIARAAIHLAIPGVTAEEADRIAKVSARHSLGYILALPKLKSTPYQTHGIDALKQAMEQDKGMVIISLHMGPPDLGTMALTEHGIAVETVIGAGKQTPLINSIGRKALDRANVSYTQRGNPTAVLQSVKKKKAVILYSDMRSKEMPVTFFGQSTTAPASGIYTALLLKAPVFFHYSTWENGRWQLHFEPFEMMLNKSGQGRRKEDVKYNLQNLMHRMEYIIRQYPELWIWHYDRFKLKKALKDTVGSSLIQEQ